MTCTWIINGKMQLVITGSTALETQMLQELFKQETEGVVKDKVVIGDKNLVDSVVITIKAGSDKEIK